MAHEASCEFCCSYSCIPAHLSPPARGFAQVMQAVIQRDIPLDYGIWKAVSPECRDLIQAMLTRDPAQRISAADAMRHPWFRHFGIGTSRLLLCVYSATGHCLRVES